LKSLNNGDETMKKIIVAVLITVFIPISYAGAQDKQTVYTVNVEASMQMDICHHQLKISITIIKRG